MAIPGTVSKQLYPGEAELLASKGTVEVCGSFETDNSAATNVVGEGFSVAGANDVYTITLAHPYPQLVSAVATIQHSSDAEVGNYVLNFGTYTASTGVLTLYVVDNGAAGVLNGQRIGFVLKFRRHNALSVTHTS